MPADETMDPLASQNAQENVVMRDEYARPLGWPQRAVQELVCRLACQIKRNLSQKGVLADVIDGCKPFSHAIGRTENSQQKETFLFYAGLP